MVTPNVHTGKEAFTMSYYYVSGDIGVTGVHVGVHVE